MLEGGDLASRAWERVKKFMDKLGSKYGFDPTQMRGISKETGEVIL
ncbi:MAG: hypothetical protein ACETWM_00065 [Candidatus Lokiarchaeia archaeon]